MKRKIALWQTCVRRAVIEVDADDNMKAFQTREVFGNVVSRCDAEKILKNKKLELNDIDDWHWAYVNE